ncbi:MAG: DUF5906 domain-containing protein [Xanthobacteraceae bacterium]|jgi:hypothetical protein
MTDANITSTFLARVFRDYADQPRWVEWRPVQGKNGKEDKVPYTPGTDRRARSNTPATWGMLAQCQGERRGWMFENGGGLDLGGVDLDACRDPQTGTLAPWASEVVAKFASYTEISPSGSGLHIFAAGVPAGFKFKKMAVPGEPIGSKQPAIEAFAARGHFLTVTGDQLPGTPNEIKAAPEAWDWLRQRKVGKGKREAKRSRKADESRHHALLDLARRLQAEGKSDDDIRAELHAANRADNNDLHEEFATKGAKEKREVDGIIKWVLREVEKGASEDDLLARLNAEYCVVQDGGKTRVLRFDPQVQMRDGEVVHTRLVPTFLSFGDFHNYFKNEKVWVTEKNGDEKAIALGNWWTSHKQRRTYLGLTFRPDKPEQVVDGRLNLWRGWGVEPKPGDWSLMRQHIREVLAAGDDGADTYITNWNAWAVQHPAERAEVALVLKGGRGVGKGTLGNALVRIFGQHATHISSVDHLAGRFNAHLRDACFLFADEAWWPGDKSAEGTLKRLITEPTLFIEAKNRDGVTVPNMLHPLISSNEDWVVPAGEHERRFAMFEASEHKRQDETWFKPLHEQLRNGGYEAMLHDLLHQELGDWHPRKIPMTEALRKQQLRSLKPLDAWVLKFFEDGVLPTGIGVDRPDRALSRSQPDPDGRNPRNGLYDLARDQPPLRYMDEQVLAAHLKQWGCTPWRSNLARGWEFPPLAKCRARWQEKYPGWTWQHPELTEWQKDDNTGPAF